MNILEMDLSEQDEKLLRESLESWKEEVYAKLLEEVEDLKESKIEELEEANLAYREELKADYAEKMIEAISEMRDEIKSEVVSEMIISNPELKVLESIKELVAPMLNEDFVGNLYAEEIQKLKEENEDLKEEKELDEGAQTLADLIAPLNEETQNIILAVIKEGNSDEVTEQFYNLIESLNLVEAEKEDDKEGDEEDDEDTDEEDGDDKDKKDKKKKKKDGEEDDDKEEDDDDMEEDVDEDVDEDFDPYVNEDENLDESEEEVVVNSYRNRMLDLIK